MSFSRRRRLLGTKAYPGSKNEEHWFVIAMLIGGFFTFGITWIALAIYLATNQKETRLQEAKRPQQTKTTAAKKKPVVIQERSKRIWSAKLDKIAEENGGVIPSPRVKDDPTTTNYGPRGGRYTEDKTKDGRPYRRYF